MKRSRGKPEWHEFRVGDLSKDPKWTNTTCGPLNTVSHVAHINGAVRILSDRLIRAGLVFDWSKLNTQRILVTWLSPNDWSGAGGFRYGNVRFTFDWKKLIEDMDYYWVEGVAYSIPAARILVTKKDRRRMLTPYDPTSRDGPWWEDVTTDTHYWNGAKCLEIMVEGDVDLADAVKIDFVDHHPQYCNAGASQCPDLGVRSARGGARFIAAVVGSGIKISRRLLKERTASGKKRLRGCMRDAIEDTLLDVMKACSGGGTVSSGGPAVALARSLLLAYGAREVKQWKSLASLFRSRKSLLGSCAKAIAGTTGLTEDLIRSIADGS